MAETPKQRIRKILDTLPLDRDMHQLIDELLEHVTEVDCEEVLYVYDGMLKDNPNLLDEFIESLEFYKDSNDEA